MQNVVSKILIILVLLATGRVLVLRQVASRCALRQDKHISSINKIKCATGAESPAEPLGRSSTLTVARAYFMIYSSLSDGCISNAVLSFAFNGEITDSPSCSSILTRAFLATFPPRFATCLFSSKVFG